MSVRLLENHTTQKTWPERVTGPDAMHTHLFPMLCFTTYCSCAATYTPPHPTPSTSTTHSMLHPPPPPPSIPLSSEAAPTGTTLTAH